MGNGGRNSGPGGGLGAGLGSGMGQGLQQRQKQSLTMTPALQQAIKLLAMASPELVEFVADEINQNPLLDWHPDQQTDQQADQQNDLQRHEAADATAASDTAPDDTPTQQLDDVIGDDGIITAATEGLDASDNALYPELAPAVMQREQAARADDADWSMIEDQAGAAQSLSDVVTAQIPDLALPVIENAIAHILVGALDETGYLGETVNEIADRHNIDPNLIDTVRQRLGTELEPIGLFAVSLAECLGWQLKARRKLNIAMENLLTRLDLVAKRDLPALKRLTGLEEEGVRSCLGLLMKLDPKPGLQFAAPEQLYIAPPDLVITPAKQQNANRQKTGDGTADDDQNDWLVRLNPETLPRVIVNEDYYALASQSARRDKDKDYLREAHARANWLTRALDQRARTILAVGQALAKRQDGFLRNGVSALVPLTMADVAVDIDMHDSTISRAIAGKTLDCPQGVFALRFFFSAALKADAASRNAGGDDHAAQAVKHRIKQLIDAEEPKKILSDDKLVALLDGEGIRIARRTVAKYREAMGLGSSVERRRQKKLS